MSVVHATTHDGEWPVIGGRHTEAELNDRVLDITLRPVKWGFVVAGVACAAVSVLLTTAISYLLLAGIGVWGVNIPAAWGMAIVNFVWWIGIGHAGTLISAILLLVRQDWRTSINRFAEAMTLFAVANAGLFPLLHLGRPIIFYYLLPYPNRMTAWPQWRSPLVWDVFAVMTYLTVSILFWYAGLLPDLASLRDRARRTGVKMLAGLGALGWRGSARQWRRHKDAYLILAGLATPLVVSVHSIVSLDFATAIVPGWHETIFPPYFVAGAIYSGFAMVFTLAIPLRWMFGLQDLITERHLNAMGKVMLCSGLIVAYGYGAEVFTAFYSGDGFSIARTISRLRGPTAPVFWATIFCNVVVGQALWFPRIRRSAIALLVVSTAVNIGMWLERYDIVIGSLEQDFTPSRWGQYVPTRWDWATYLGTLGFFTLLFLLFVRLIPIMSGFELKGLWHELRSGTREPDFPQETRGGLLALRNRMRVSASDEGVAAEFEDSGALLIATRIVRRAGLTNLETYTPRPVEGIDQALGLGSTGVPLIMLLGAILGGGGAYFIQWYSAVVAYPWDVGGRPLHAWPSFVPLTFELAVLGASLAGFFGMLALNRFPQLYHPVSDVPAFDRASRDRYFLWIGRDDPLFDEHRLRALLAGAGALRVAPPQEVSV
jgi:Ni/Fe-hydrogenase subunit HybB-like protein